MARAGPFLPGPRAQLAASGGGPLDGLSFAVKDLIDVAGQTTGGGNPDWLAAAAPAVATAPAVARLLAAGACMAGRTISDELAFSLEGANAHYGTPKNPACPGRLPGGSSSGSAVAVAAGLVDFALGTDTGGSVRVPAAFCGVHGFRPSHGRIPLDGVLPFAPSYDTVGWFAREAETLARVGGVLLGPEEAAPIRHLLVARDAFDLADEAVATILAETVATWGGGADIDVFEDRTMDWLEAYRVLQGWEVHRGLGPRIAALRPRFGPAIAARFAEAAAITEAERWRPFRQACQRRLETLLPPGTALLLPTAPTPALPISAPAAEIGAFYRRALTIGSIAGHAGLPQRQIPAGTVDGCPVGLSLVGRAGSDLALLAAMPGR